MAEVFKIFAGAAGFAGLALAVVFYLMKDIIARALNLGRERAYKLMRLIILCSAALGVAGILVWGAISLQPHQTATLKGEGSTVRQSIGQGSSGGRQAVEIEGNNNSVTQEQ